jgi:hypothetical protein
MLTQETEHLRREIEERAKERAGNAQMLRLLARLQQGTTDELSMLQLEELLQPQRNLIRAARVHGVCMAPVRQHHRPTTVARPMVRHIYIYSNNMMTSRI